MLLGLPQMRGLVNQKREIAHDLRSNHFNSTCFYQHPVMAYPEGIEQMNTIEAMMMALQAMEKFSQGIFADQFTKEIKALRRAIQREEIKQRVLQRFNEEAA